MFVSLVSGHPWWLLLLIPIVIGVFTRIPSTYISKAHSHIAPFFLIAGTRWGRALRYIVHTLPSFVSVLVLILIVVALVDVTRGYVVVVGQKISQRLIVALDVSSSMYGFSTNLPTVTCRKNSMLFPRIHGSCRALYRVVDDIEKETKDELRPRILIGLMQWAYRSAVVSYPTSDYKRYREKIDMLEFRSHNLGASTGMHGALWDMFLMSLDRNMKKNSGFMHFSGKDMQVIYASLAPGPKESSLYLPKDIMQKVAKVKEEMRDTVFIIPTDAVVSYLESRMDGQHPSIRRLLQLAEIFEIPVYFISTDEDYPELKRLARRTGFGPAGGLQRGDFKIVRKEGDAYLIDEVMSGVLKSRFGLTVPTYETRRESYADLALELALTFALFGVLWKKLVVRSLTDRE
ncbi:MAG: hypothetical protein Q7R91_02355 [bacterium]|nr:hypothetical protein [bacterium]